MSVNAVNSDGSLSKIAGGINTNDTDIIKSDLSYVEPYTTASVAHAQGDCFVMNTGQLVRATSAIDIGDTIELETNVTTISITELLAEKVNKVDSATAGNFAGLDSNGNLTDSGHKHSDYLTQHQDISGKADKVTGATNGNLAKLDANGNLADGGWSSVKTTTSATGNPISLSGLKSNQLAINPIVTFTSAVGSVTLKVANGSDPTAPGYAVSTDISESLGESASGTWNVRTGVFTKSNNTTIQLTPHEVVLVDGNNYVSSNGTSISLSYHNGEMASLEDVSQLGETLNALGDLSINGIGSIVDLASYNTTGNMYTFPADGYVGASSEHISSGNVKINVYGANGTILGGIGMSIGMTYQLQQLFVRKGMKCYVVSRTNGAEAFYKPFV